MKLFPVLFFQGYFLARGKDFLHFQKILNA